MLRAHSFHIPVMGIGYTIDTPLKVAQYGIDSVISIGDDFLLEKIREYLVSFSSYKLACLTTKKKLLCRLIYM